MGTCNPFALMSSLSVRRSSGGISGNMSAAGWTRKTPRQLPRPCWGKDFALCVIAKVSRLALGGLQNSGVLDRHRQSPGCCPGSYCSGGGGLSIAARLRARAPVLALIDADRFGEQTGPGPTIYRPWADTVPLCKSAVGFELLHALLPLRRSIRDVDGGGHVAPHRSDCDGEGATTFGEIYRNGLVGN